MLIWCGVLGLIVVTLSVLSMRADAAIVARPQSMLSIALSTVGGIGYIATSAIYHAEITINTVLLLIVSTCLLLCGGIVDPITMLAWARPSRNQPKWFWIPVRICWTITLCLLIGAAWYAMRWRG